MKSALVLGCISAIVLGACTPSHATSTSAASVSSSASPAAGSASAAPGSTLVAAQAVPSPDPTQPANAAVPGGPTPSPQPSSDPDAPAAAVTAAPQVPNVQKTAEPAATSTPTAIPYLAPDAPPQILAFSISSSTVSPGDTLSGSVTASSNVASVEVRVAGFSYNMTKTSPGVFELAVTVPSVPRMFRRTYPLVAIARNTRGDATQRTTQITIR